MSLPVSFRSLLRHSGAQLRLAAGLLLATSFTGCASYNHIANYPAPAKPVGVAVTTRPLSKMSELPVGAFYDEKHQIVITGHQKGLGVGMMFGLVGVLVADQANKSSAESRFGASSNGSDVDLAALTRTAVQEAVAAGHAPQWTAADTGNLRLASYAVFTVNDSGKAKLYAMLSAEQPIASGDKPWNVHYFVPAEGEYFIEAADGWMTNGRFKAAMAKALAEAVQLCIDDTHGKLTEAKKMKAKGRFAMVNAEFDLPVIVVQEDEEKVVARLAVGDAMIMSGTHVLPRAQFKLTDFDFKDPR